VLAIVEGANQKRLFVVGQMAASHDIFKQIGLYLLGQLVLQKILTQLPVDENDESCREENMDKNVNLERFSGRVVEKRKHVSSAFVHAVSNTANRINR
jgi:hypothetical protein